MSLTEFLILAHSYGPYRYGYCMHVGIIYTVVICKPAASPINGNGSTYLIWNFNLVLDFYGMSDMTNAIDTFTAENREHI